MNASPSPRRIWVTRPRNQSAGLQTRLIEIGLAPVMLPLLEIASADDPAPLHDALARLADYDLAIFVSPSALEKVFEALTAPWPEQLPVAVMGPGSAELAKQLAIARIIQPASQFDSAGTKVNSTSTTPCAQRKGLSSRVRAVRGTLDTLEVTKSSPPTGGVIMPSVKPVPGLVQ